MIFRRLGIQIDDVTRTSVLRDRVRAVEGNLDFSKKDIGALPPTDAEDKLRVTSALNQVGLPLEVCYSVSPCCPSKSNIFGLYNRIPNNNWKVLVTPCVSHG